MSNINWQAKRQVFVTPDSGEAWVGVDGRFMEFDDYRQDGGHVWDADELSTRVFVGTFTNAEISNMGYPQ